MTVPPQGQFGPISRFHGPTTGTHIYIYHMGESLMSDDKQLSLLDWTPPSPHRKVIPFPRIRRKEEIRAISRALFGKKDRAAVKAWNDKIAQIRRQMSKAGFDDAIIDQEIESFRSGVQSELDRMAWVDHAQSRPGS